MRVRGVFCCADDADERNPDGSEQHPPKLLVVVVNAGVGTRSESLQEAKKIIARMVAASRRSVTRLPLPSSPRRPIGAARLGKLPRAQESVEALRHTWQCRDGELLANDNRWTISNSRY